MADPLEANRTWFCWLAPHRAQNWEVPGAAEAALVLSGCSRPGSFGHSLTGLFSSFSGVRREERGPQCVFRNGRVVRVLQGIQVNRAAPARVGEEAAEATEAASCGSCGPGSAESAHCVECPAALKVLGSYVQEEATWEPESGRLARCFTTLVSGKEWETGPVGRALRQVGRKPAPTSHICPLNFCVS